MTKLAPFMVSKKLTETAKVYIALAHLNGSATTSEIKQCASANGAKTAKYWNVAAIFGSGGERIAKLDGKWTLLPEGKIYVVEQGYQIEAAAQESQPPSQKPAGRIKIAIGHGHSKLWKELKEWLRDNYECEVLEFNSQSVVGITNVDRLKQLIDQANFAFLIMTAEDESSDGTQRARQNVIHEVGLFQGTLGFQNAAILLEADCEEFSNIAGLGQIRFPSGDLATSFEEIRKYMKDNHGMV